MPEVIVVELRRVGRHRCDLNRGLGQNRIGGLM
jgi:hypothetical protein